MGSDPLEQGMAIGWAVLQYQQCQLGKEVDEVALLMVFPTAYLGSCLY